MGQIWDGVGWIKDDYDVPYVVPAANVLGSYTASVGDLVFLDDTDGNFKLADYTSSAKATVQGVVVVAASAAGGSFSLARIGDSVPLSTFGNLAFLNALGNTHAAYVGAAASGKIAIAPVTSSGNMIRLIFFSPKRFASLVQGDLTTMVRLLFNIPTAA